MPVGVLICAQRPHLARFAISFPVLSHTDHTVAVPSRISTVALGSNGQPSKSQRLVSYRDVIWARKMPLVTSVHDMPLVEPGQIAPTSVVSGHVVGSRPCGSPGCLQTLLCTSRAINVLQKAVGAGAFWLAIRGSNLDPLCNGQ